MQTARDTEGKILVNARLTDRSNFVARISPIGVQEVAQPYRLCGVPFEGTTIDSRFWTAISSGTGASVAQAGGLVTLQSGTDNSGYGQISTVRRGRFMFAHPHMYRAAVRVPTTAVALNTRRWGAFSISTITPQNGFYFEIDPDGALSVVRCNAGSASSVASGAFNGNLGLTYTMDSNVHAYEIVFFTMGAWFFIDGVLLHKLLPTTARFTATNSLPVTVTTSNTAAGVTNGTLEIWDSILLRMGRDITESTSYYHAAGTTAEVVLKRSPGHLHALLISAVSNNSVLILYDNTAASGTVIWTSGSLPANAQPFSMNMDIPFQIGLTMEVSTANLSAVVAYE